MNNFVQNFFGYITSSEGFYMDQYMSKYRGEGVWIAQKKFTQGIFAVIITDGKHEEVDSVEALDYLNGKNEPFTLHKIVLSGDNYIHGLNDAIPKVVFNIEKNKSIYCDSGCEALARIAIKVQEKEEKNFRIPVKESRLTILLISINIVIYIISAFLSKNIMDIDGSVLLFMGGKYGPLIERGEVWRLITCNFLHGGLIHIAFNMYALYSIGTQIEILYGKVKYLVIYFMAGLGSSLLSYYLSPFTLSIGASGAIFGLLGALLVYAIKERGRLKKGVLSNLLVVIGMNLFIGLSLPNIDNYGHVGGLIVGMIISVIIIVIPKKVK
ncbi:rhomboid family intramembrane serine protease [Clostridium paraputrificum]|uniref:rhomboid family intramembrane serine protease n=1 Tax=Clostridium TaxID=1485 RepID=UPI003D3584C5